MKRIFALLLIIPFLIGCAVTEVYAPSGAPVPIDSLLSVSSAGTQMYPIRLAVGDFNSSAFSSVDVVHNIDVTVDCTGFGTFLRKTIFEGLSRQRVFKDVSLYTMPIETPHLVLSGRIMKMTIINNWGASYTAKAELVASLELLADKKTIWTTSIKADGTSPGSRITRNWTDKFSASLDYLGPRLAAKLINELTTSREVAGILFEHPELRVASQQQEQPKVSADTTSSYKPQEKPTVPPVPKLLIGKVTSLHGDVVELDIGAVQGAKVGDSGRILYKVTIDGKEKPVYLARFRITHISERSCMARIEESTGEVRVGHTVEIKLGTD